MKNILFAVSLFVCFVPLLQAGVVIGQSTVTVSASVVPDTLVDNFDDGLDPNIWGGGYGVIGITTATVIAYDATVRTGSSGASLRVSYNLPDSATYTGLEITLAPSSETRNVSTHTYFSCDILGQHAGQTFKIEFENARGERGAVNYTAYVDSGTSTSWTHVKIPLDAFAGFTSVSNMSDLKFIRFVFEHDFLAAGNLLTASTIYVDNIGFSKDVVSVVRIAHFGDHGMVDALGGNIGDWSRDNYGGYYSSLSTTVFHNHARSFRSSYDTTENHQRGGHYFVFGVGGVEKPHDFSAYNRVTMYVKGEEGQKPPDTFAVQLADNSGTVGYVLVPAQTTTPSIAISSATWNKYIMNLNNFTSGGPTGGTAINTSILKKMAMLYEDWRTGVGSSKGAIYLDEIQFEK